MKLEELNLEGLKIDASQITHEKYKLIAIADKIIRYFGLKGKFLTVDQSQNNVAHTNNIKYKIVPLTADTYER